MSLTYTAYISRKIIKYGGVSLILSMVLWWIGSAIVSAYRLAHPPKLEPTIRYGILDKIVFPEKQFDKKTFSLELVDDRFPKFSDQANVYVIYRSKSVIGALEEAKKTALSMGFKTDPREVSTGIYEFKNEANNQLLTINVLNGNFKFSYPYLSDQMLLTGNMPSKEEAVNMAKTFLNNSGKMFQDINDGETKFSYWKIEFEGLKEVAGLKDANIIRVDFFRKKLSNDLAIVGEESNKASVSVLVSGSTVAAKKIVEVNYKYVNIDQSAPSTYPMKTPEQAFEDLKIGYYWPVKDSSKKEVTIRNVTLAYFEPINQTQFLQPIYVFEGDDFVGYVPAIVDDYLK